MDNVIAQLPPYMMSDASSYAEHVIDEDFVVKSVILVVLVTFLSWIYQCVNVFCVLRLRQSLESCVTLPALDVKAYLCERFGSLLTQSLMSKVTNVINRERATKKLADKKLLETVPSIKDTEWRTGEKYRKKGNWTSHDATPKGPPDLDSPCQQDFFLKSVMVRRRRNEAQYTSCEFETPRDDGGPKPMRITTNERKCLADNSAAVDDPKSRNTTSLIERKWWNDGAALNETTTKCRRDASLNERKWLNNGVLNDPTDTSLNESTWNSSNEGTLKDVFVGGWQGAIDVSDRKEDTLADTRDGDSNERKVIESIWKERKLNDNAPPNEKKFKDGIFHERKVIESILKERKLKDNAALMNEKKLKDSSLNERKLKDSSLNVRKLNERKLNASLNERKPTKDGSGGVVSERKCSLFRGKKWRESVLRSGRLDERRLNGLLSGGSAGRTGGQEAGGTPRPSRSDDISRVTFQPALIYPVPTSKKLKFNNRLLASMKK